MFELWQHKVFCECESNPPSSLMIIREISRKWLEWCFTGHPNVRSCERLVSREITHAAPSIVEEHQKPRDSNFCMQWGLRSYHSCRSFPFLKDLSFVFVTWRKRSNPYKKFSEFTSFLIFDRYTDQETLTWEAEVDDDHWFLPLFSYDIHSKHQDLLTL